MLLRLRTALRKVEAAQQQLEQDGRRYLTELQSKDPARAESFRRRLERQRARQEQVRTRLADELAAAEKLEPGAEYPQGTIEGFVEIGLGDNLSEKLRSAEIVVKDGVVVELRQG